MTAKQDANWLRSHGSAERVAWVGRQPCVFCHRTPTEEQPSHNHHVRGGGMSRKADARFIVPACVRCHALAHNGGSRLTRDELLVVADNVEASWQHHLSREPPE